MSEKRRDTKGRILRTGESQRKDGKYEYKYVTVSGERRSVYSWKLVDTDKVPPGKRCDKPLRDLENEIKNATENGIDISKSYDITFDECFQKYIESKQFKLTTMTHYQMIKKRLYPYIGNIPILSITKPIIANAYKSLLNRNTISPSTTNTMNEVVKGVFSYAKEQKWIQENPCNKVMKAVFPSGVHKNKRNALSVEEQCAFLQFIHEDHYGKNWEDLMIVILETGCRFNEIAGLQWSDCDFNKEIITIKKGLHVVNVDGTNKLIMSTPKSSAGYRNIPMIPEVKQALLNTKGKNQKCSISVDGYDDFVFLTKYNKPIQHPTVLVAMKRMRNRYNEQHKGDDNYVPLLNITPHILRHTFCTRYCENETNLKAIQEVMGHSNISITLGIYATVTEKQKQDSMINLNHKLLPR